MQSFCFTLLLESNGDWTAFRKVCDELTAHQQKTLLRCVLRVLSKRLAEGHDDKKEPLALDATALNVAAGASLISGVCHQNDMLLDELVSWLSTVNGGGVGEPIDIRRAAVCVVAQKEGRSSVLICRSRAHILLEKIQKLLENTMAVFSDKLYIKHTPLLAQEGMPPP